MRRPGGIVDGLEGASRVGVMGGTFDPPHNGHFQIAREVATAKKLDRVMLVPAAQPWQKAGYSPAEDRLAMTLLGVSDDPRFLVSRIELDRPGPTYTLDTMAELSVTYPAIDFFFIVGADAALNLGTWHRVQELVGSTRIIAVARPGFDLGALPRPPGFEIEVVEVSPVDVSSTEIRAAVGAGRSIGGLVPPKVAEYISSHGLYRHRVEQDDR